MDNKVQNLWTRGAMKGQSVKCAYSHPIYKIKTDTATYEIVGGSCTRTYPEDVDVFIALDWAGTKGKRSLPWNEGIDIYFEIPDMKTPTNKEEFDKLIHYTAGALIAGKSVFVGCIGGHGRTGLFLAALTTYMTGDLDSIKTVREGYCYKAIESSSQVNWLKKHYDIKPMKGSKVSNKKGTIKGHPPYQENLGEDWPTMNQGVVHKVTKAKPRIWTCAVGSSLLANKLLDK